MSQDINTNLLKKSLNTKHRYKLLKTEQSNSSNYRIHKLTNQKTLIFFPVMKILTTFHQQLDIKIQTLLLQVSKKETNGHQIDLMEKQ
jgi:hypothetical protein